jgi:hypothetical protein
MIPHKRPTNCILSSKNVPDYKVFLNLSSSTNPLPRKIDFIGQWFTLLFLKNAKKARGFWDVDGSPTLLRNIDLYNKSHNTGRLGTQCVRQSSLQFAAAF